MKVFISSLISGMEPIREVAREAITTLRHDPIMAEKFGAQPASPQVACLNGVRQSDLVALILGEKYGSTQASGLSATHEEYREAKATKPIIAFVQEGISPEPEQQAFIKEVQAWQGGLFRGGFRIASELKISLTRALHDYDLARATGPVNDQEILERAKALLPKERSGVSGNAAVNIAVAGGPCQSILRPIEIENPSLADAIHQNALFGPNRIFNPSLGVQKQLDGQNLMLNQERGQSQIVLNEQGSVLVSLPLTEGRQMLPQIVEEFVQKQLTDALAFSSWVLDRIDSTERLTHVAVAVSISQADYMGWRTQRENDASPHNITVAHRAYGNQRSPVHISRARAALRLDSAHVVEDLLVPLRRQWR